jgi:Arc/MetJ-type ribon-helix-helix transcriptional regulator
MIDEQFSSDGEGVSNGFFPVLQTFTKSANACRKLSGLVALSFAIGRDGDCSSAWGRDLDLALDELPWVSERRRPALVEHLKDRFNYGQEAHWVDNASPPEMARDFANGLALASAHRLKRAPAGEQDAAIAEVAERVARDLPVSPAAAARAVVDAFARHGIPGTEAAACEAMIAARLGWQARGGFGAEMRETEEEILSGEFASASDAVNALTAALVERHHEEVGVAVELALTAAEQHGLEVTEDHAEAAMAAGHAAVTAWQNRWTEDADDYPSAKPPAWWDEFCNGGIPDRFELNREPGLLGDLARFSVDYAFRPVQEFAVLVALATLAPVFSRRHFTPTGAGLNLYLAGLAETGGGKEAVLSAPAALLSAAKLDFLIGAGDFTSDSAIELALRSRPNFIALIDEVSELIGSTQHRNAAPHSRTLRKAMLELYSKGRPDARWSGKQKVDVDHADKAAQPIYSPHLSLLGCATTTGFFESLTEGNLTGGFVNRWIVVRGGKPGAFNADPARLKVPESLSNALTAAYAGTTEGNLNDAAARDPFRKPSMRFVPWGDGGEEAWNAVLLSQCEAVDAGRADFVGRAAENCLKVATIRALARDGATAAVTDRDVLWAWEIVRASVDIVEAGARDNMAGSEFEMLCKTMEREIVGAGPDGIAYSRLIEKRGIAKHTKPMLDGAIERLVQRGMIYRPTIGAGSKGGRPGLRVTATQFTAGDYHRG